MADETPEDFIDGFKSEPFDIEGVWDDPNRPMQIIAPRDGTYVVVDAATSLGRHVTVKQGEVIASYVPGQPLTVTGLLPPV